MTNRLAIDPASVGILEGPAFMEHTEDGPQATWFVQVGATSADGKRDFAHFHGFRPARRESAEELADKVRAAGVID